MTTESGWSAGKSVRSTLLALVDSSPAQACSKALECLAASDPDVRIAGIECLAELNHDPGLDAMAQLLRDPEALVRVAALELVVEGAQTSTAILEELVSSDRGEVVRAYAGWAIGKLGKREALATLRARLVAEESAVVRGSLLEALYRLTKHPPYLDMLLALLSSSDPEARAFASNSAVGVLTRDNAACVIDALRRAATDETFPAIRAVVADNLETAKDMQREDDFETE